MGHMAKFDLEAIQQRMDDNPIAPPEVVREAKAAIEAEEKEFNLTIAEKTIAELKELFA